eukprot:scaffold117647_cov45-Prasinocladus_malaysianus.AAC.1
MCEALSTKKGEKTLAILQNVYTDADVIFLQGVLHFMSCLLSFWLQCTLSDSFAIIGSMQEVAAEWLRLFVASPMAKEFHLLSPGQLDSKRNQNSVILLRKEPFALETAIEVTQDVIAELPKEPAVPVAAGDMCAYTISSKKVTSALAYPQFHFLRLLSPLKHIRQFGNNYLLASFHGDTNGLATIPIVNAVAEVAKKKDNPSPASADANSRALQSAPLIYAMVWWIACIAVLARRNL